jgi:hypothetical protein
VTEHHQGSWALRRESRQRAEPQPAQCLERDQRNTRMGQLMMSGGDAFPTTALHRSCPSLLQSFAPCSFLLPSPRPRHLVVSKRHPYLQHSLSHSPRRPSRTFEASSIIYCAWYPRLPQQYLLPRRPTAASVATANHHTSYES